MSDAAVAVVKYCLLGFNILGTFGNLNIIIATLKHKRLQHKCGILLGILACCDLICLWFEMQSFIRISFGLTETSLRTCFWANSGYIFMETLEVYVIIALAIDRQFAIASPIRYRMYSISLYFFFLLSPGIIIGLSFTIASYLQITNVTREICVLPYAMPDEVSTVWNHYNMLGAIVTMVVYSFTYLKLYYFDSFRNDPGQCKKQKAILSTVIVQALIFFFSSVLSAILIMSVRALGWESLATNADVLAVIPGLLGYTCNFYVYFWRSAEYRGIFQRQIFCGHVLVPELHAFPVTVASVSGPRSR